MERISEEGVASLCATVEKVMKMEGIPITCKPVRGTAWMAWKIEVSGPSSRSGMDPEFSAERQTGVFTPRQLRLALKARSIYAFWGWMVK